MGRRERSPQVLSVATPILALVLGAVLGVRAAAGPNPPRDRQVITTVSGCVCKPQVWDPKSKRSSQIACIRFVTARDFRSRSRATSRWEQAALPRLMRRG
eukprot:SAG31_NODE_25734_length_455_cov_1.016854_1_plen_99_part_10